MEDAYDLASQTIQEVLQNGRSLKSVVFNGYAQNKKKVYAIAIETLKQKNVLQKVLEDAGLSSDTESYYFWMVLAYEHAFGNARSVSEYAREQNVEPQLKMIVNACSQIKSLDANKEQKNAEQREDVGNAFTLPKYVRVNTLKSTMDEVISELVENGYEEKRLDTATLTFRKWRKTVRKLNRETFLRDFDFPDAVLVFAHNADLHTLSGYGAGRFIITDKSSMLPALALAPPRGAFVLDACAAPGNKTALLGSILANTGTIFAFDRDASRFQTLQRRLRQIGLRNVVCANCDFLRLAPNADANADAGASAKPRGRPDSNSQRQFRPDPTRGVDLAALNRVEYILVDPSCSGSGMVARFANDAEFANNEVQSHAASFGTLKNVDRLRKLSNFQSMLLRHALTAFPNAKRVIYSTCSLFEEENEMVVRDVMSHEEVRSRYKLVLPEFAAKLGGVKRPQDGDADDEQDDEQVASKGQKRKADSQDAEPSSSKKRKREAEAEAEAETVADDELSIETIKQLSIRIDPRRALTNGFFVACFERLSDA